jgi:hypothetical protein
MLAAEALLAAATSARNGSPERRQSRPSISVPSRRAPRSRRASVPATEPGSRPTIADGNPRTSITVAIYPLSWTTAHFSWKTSLTD